ncbi:MAG: glycosyltransferase [Melioribacteraceae bacterium]|nr:glycosyltransferase [Melioribacteraceae bacterium]
MRKIVVFGPGPIFKGGIALFTASLARTISNFDDVEIHLVSWKNQYPAIIPRDFIDRSSQSDILENSKVKIRYVTNYNNPFSWHSTVNLIEEISPEIIIIQWAVAVQGLPLGFISSKIKKKINCEIIFDLHVVEQKEQTSIDKYFLKYALSNGDTFIVHSPRTIDELKRVFPEWDFVISKNGERVSDKKNILNLYHPIYDIYKSNIDFNADGFKRELGLKKHVFLFFGFIRKYKGLHHIIPAFAKLCKERKDVSLLIVGESFWSTLNKRKLSTKVKHLLFSSVKKIFAKNQNTESDYSPLQLIEEYNINDNCVVINKYIPNEEVYKYYQSADYNFLYYTIATPSGVESIAYNFGVPSIAVKAGHFLDTIQDGINGYFAEPENEDSLYNTMLHALNNPIDNKSVLESSRKYSWNNYVQVILNK